MSRDADWTVPEGPARMTHPPRITDESVLSRWMGMELKKMNAGIVSERRTLVSLLGEDCPSAPTKGGDTHWFRREILVDLGERLPGHLTARLRLPIIFILSPDVPDSCSCSDGTAFAALQALGEISPLRTFEGGKFWVARAIAYAMVQKYPSVIQVVMGA
jgi:hypothetical protein